MNKGRMFLTIRMFTGEFHESLMEEIDPSFNSYVSEVIASQFITLLDQVPRKVGPQSVNFMWSLEASEKDDEHINSSGTSDLSLFRMTDTRALSVEKSHEIIDAINRDFQVKAFDSLLEEVSKKYAEDGDLEDLNILSGGMGIMFKITPKPEPETEEQN